MMMALKAEARLTSSLVMAPAAACRMRTRTSSLESFSMACLTASTEPCTSALMMRLRLVILPSSMEEKRFSMVSLDASPRRCARSFSLRSSATWRDRWSSPTAIISSPALGTSSKPMISTGMEGPASFTFSPRSLISARTRPLAMPAMMLSPTCRVPFWRSTVARGPLALSSLASMMTPRPRRFGLALSSMTSACRRTISRRSSTP